MAQPGAKPFCLRLLHRSIGKLVWKLKFWGARWGWWLCIGASACKWFFFFVASEAPSNNLMVNRAQFANPTASAFGGIYTATIFVFALAPSVFSFRMLACSVLFEAWGCNRKRLDKAFIEVDCGMRLVRYPAKVPQGNKTETVFASQPWASSSSCQWDQSQRSNIVKEEISFEKDWKNVVAMFTFSETMFRKKIKNVFWRFHAAIQSKTNIPSTPKPGTMLMFGT